jgi:hypothetical protein
MAELVKAESEVLRLPGKLMDVLEAIVTHLAIRMIVLRRPRTLFLLLRLDSLGLIAL